MGVSLLVAGQSGVARRCSAEGVVAGPKQSLRGFLRLRSGWTRQWSQRPLQTRCREGQVESSRDEEREQCCRLNLSPCPVRPATYHRHQTNRNSDGRCQQSCRIPAAANSLPLASLSQIICNQGPYGRREDRTQQAEDRFQVAGQAGHDEHKRQRTSDSGPDASASIGQCSAIRCRKNQAE